MPRALSTIRAFLLDMDGTIYLGDRLLDGAAEFLAALKRTGRPYLFFTNNSSKDAGEYAEKLTRLGVETTPDQVMTSGQATVDYLRTKLTVKRALVLGTPSFEGEVTSAGIELVDGGKDTSPPEAVVLAFDMTLTYEKIRRACDWIQRGVPFVASHPDLVCPTPEGPIPDCGAMIAMITAATGVEPTVIGKPYPAMAEAALRKLGVQADETAIVGDRLYTDIAMGHAAGLHTILVLSGEATIQDFTASQQKPERLAASVADLTPELD